jgi:hypothetical protein
MQNVLYFVNLLSVSRMVTLCSATHKLMICLLLPYSSRSLECDDAERRKVEVVCMECRILLIILNFYFACVTQLLLHVYSIPCITLLTKQVLLPAKFKSGHHCHSMRHLNPNNKGTMKTNLILGLKMVNFVWISKIQHLTKIHEFKSS